MHSTEHTNKILKLLKFFHIVRNDVLLIHSSFKQLSQDGYCPNDTLQTIVKYMATGTLLLPTMSWRFVNQKNPIFHEIDTPCNTGILAELFRKNFATHRSIHPTHSVAGIGMHAKSILATHNKSTTPCDNLSPFGQLAKFNAMIIMLGVGIDCCTMLHHAEEIYAPDIYVKPTINKYTCITRYNKQTSVNVRHHLFLPRNYWQFQDELAKQGKLQLFRCDNSIALGFKTKDIVECAEGILKNFPDKIIAKPGERYRMM